MGDWANNTKRHEEILLLARVFDMNGKHDIIAAITINSWYRLVGRSILS